MGSGMFLEQHLWSRFCGQFGGYNLPQCFCPLHFIGERERREQVKEKCRQVNSHLMIMTSHSNIIGLDYIRKAI